MHNYRDIHLPDLLDQPDLIRFFRGVFVHSSVSLSASGIDSSCTDRSMKWFYAKLKEGAHGDLSVLNSLLLGFQKQYKGEFSVEKRRHPLFSDVFDRLGYWKEYNAYVFSVMQDNVCNTHNPYTAILDNINVSVRCIQPLMEFQKKLCRPGGDGTLLYAAVRRVLDEHDPQWSHQLGNVFNELQKGYSLTRVLQTTDAIFLIIVGFISQFLEEVDHYFDGDYAFDPNILKDKLLTVNECLSFLEMITEISLNCHFLYIIALHRCVCSIDKELDTHKHLFDARCKAMSDLFETSYPCRFDFDSLDRMIEKLGICFSEGSAAIFDASQLGFLRTEFRALNERKTKTLSFFDDVYGELTCQHLSLLSASSLQESTLFTQSLLIFWLSDSVDSRIQLGASLFLLRTIFDQLHLLLEQPVHMDLDECVTFSRLETIIDYSTRLLSSIQRDCCTQNGELLYSLFREDLLSPFRVWSVSLFEFLPCFLDKQRIVDLFNYHFKQGELPRGLLFLTLTYTCLAVDIAEDSSSSLSWWDTGTFRLSCQNVIKGCFFYDHVEWCSILDLGGSYYGWMLLVSLFQQASQPREILKQVMPSYDWSLSERPFCLLENPLAWDMLIPLCLDGRANVLSLLVTLPKLEADRDGGNKLFPIETWYYQLVSDVEQELLNTFHNICQFGRSLGDSDYKGDIFFRLELKKLQQLLQWMKLLIGKTSSLDVDQQVYDLWAESLFWMTSLNSDEGSIVWSQTGLVCQLVPSFQEPLLMSLRDVFTQHRFSMDHFQSHVNRYLGKGEPFSRGLLQSVIVILNKDTISIEPSQPLVIDQSLLKEFFFSNSDQLTAIHFLGTTLLCRWLKSLIQVKDHTLFYHRDGCLRLSRKTRFSIFTFLNESMSSLARFFPLPIEALIEEVSVLLSEGSPEVTLSKVRHLSSELDRMASIGLAPDQVVLGQSLVHLCLCLLSGFDHLDTVEFEEYAVIYSESFHREVGFFLSVLLGLGNSLENVLERAFRILNKPDHWEVMFLYLQEVKASVGKRLLVKLLSFPVFQQAIFDWDKALWMQLFKVSQMYLFNKIDTDLDQDLFQLLQEAVISYSSKEACETDIIRAFLSIRHSVLFHDDASGVPHHPFSLDDLGALDEGFIRELEQLESFSSSFTESSLVPFLTQLMSVPGLFVRLKRHYPCAYICMLYSISYLIRSNQHGALIEGLEASLLSIGINIISLLKLKDVHFTTTWTLFCCLKAPYDKHHLMMLFATLFYDDTQLDSLVNIFPFWEPYFNQIKQWLLVSRVSGVVEEGRIPTVYDKQEVISHLITCLAQQDFVGKQRLLWGLSDVKGVFQKRYADTTRTLVEVSSTLLNDQLDWLTFYRLTQEFHSGVQDIIFWNGKVSHIPIVTSVNASLRITRVMGQLMSSVDLLVELDIDESWCSQTISNSIEVLLRLIFQDHKLFELSLECSFFVKRLMTHSFDRPHPLLRLLWRASCRHNYINRLVMLLDVGLGKDALSKGLFWLCEDVSLFDGFRDDDYNVFVFSLLERDVSFTTIFQALSLPHVKRQCLASLFRCYPELVTTLFCECSSLSRYMQDIMGRFQEGLTANHVGACVHQFQLKSESDSDSEVGVECDFLSPNISMILFSQVQDVSWFNFFLDQLMLYRDPYRAHFKRALLENASWLHQLNDYWKVLLGKPKINSDIIELAGLSPYWNWGQLPVEVIHLLVKDEPRRLGSIRDLVVLVKVLTMARQRGDLISLRKGFLLHHQRIAKLLQTIIHSQYSFLSKKDSLALLQVYEDKPVLLGQLLYDVVDEQQTYLIFVLEWLFDPLFLPGARHRFFIQKDVFFRLCSSSHVGLKTQCYLIDWLLLNSKNHLDKGTYPTIYYAAQQALLQSVIEWDLTQYMKVMTLSDDIP